MSPAWQIAIVMLWILFVAVTATLVGLARQVGVISLSLRPRDRGRGPGIGMKAPAFAGRDVTERVSSWSLKATTGRPRVMAFLSGDCGSCAELVPALNALARDRPDVEAVAIFPGRASDAVAFTKRTTLSLPALIEADTEAFTLYNVQLTPHVVVVDDNDVVRASGPARSSSDVQELLSVLSGTAADHDGSADAQMHDWPSPRVTEPEGSPS